MRGVFTLEGTLGDDWSWNAYYQHSTVRYCASIHSATISTPNITAAEDAVTVTTANRGTSSLPLGTIVCRSSLPGQAAVVVGSVTAQPGCIPLDVFGHGVASPNAIRYITGSNTDFETCSIEPGCGGRLDAGHAALGTAGRQGRGRLRRRLPQGSGASSCHPDRQPGAALPPANYTNFPSASYNVMEGFAEVDAPILKNNIVNSLDFSAGGPHDQLFDLAAWSRPGNWASPARSMTTSSCAPPGRWTFARRS